MWCMDFMEKAGVVIFQAEGRQTSFFTFTPAGYFSARSANDSYDPHHTNGIICILTHATLSLSTD
jgi:hypothetical protein